MTVIAWDGKTLSADKRAVANGMPRTVTKIHKVPGGVVAFSGSRMRALVLLDWFMKGADLANFPPGSTDLDQHADALFATTDRELYLYCDGPQTMPDFIVEPYMAMGSGRDFAMAAMACGQSSKEAVVLASNFDVFCGNGVDTMDPQWEMKKDVNDAAAFPFP